MDHLKMYFLLKMGIFQPAMLVYQRVAFAQKSDLDVGNIQTHANAGQSLSSWEEHHFEVRERYLFWNSMETSDVGEDGKIVDGQNVGPKLLEMMIFGFHLYIFAWFRSGVSINSKTPNPSDLIGHPGNHRTLRWLNWCLLSKCLSWLYKSLFFSNKKCFGTWVLGV